ncbi:MULTISPECIES: creatininase family protein [Brucella/Ochrobactrum group]|uniref:Creatininase family protein n=2 Tax=Ochrobactrum TaxID=528 RepID=A0ABD5JTE0_9HYPH|nr:MULTISPECIES: creatininase family protein [Brucella]MCI1001214.1 creatininase family protein [Ochrobactrum sp. C6C9]RRD24546.1 creatininase family protein [Brucellaceae bacterium VT-16-1752]WHT43230.1 creatininase family protein [Ochrobactrum sp. SSR]MDX4074279.1 creatininase family protein [Brucella sp. NBRC 113783]RLL74016.1 creatininase family protein [[Ochrobactrum] soli]
MKRYWSDYTSEAFSRLERDKLVAVLPVGAIEQHGPHLPMCVDAAVADGMVAELIKRLPDTSKVLFLPTQAIAKSNEHKRYPGTLTFSVETVIRMWCEIGTCVAASGVRKMVLFNSHGGNIPVMDIVARELRVQHNMMVFCLNWFGLGMPDGVYSEHDLKHGIHAGDMETSVMLEMHPDLVVMEKAQDFRTLTEVFADEYKHISLGGGAKPAWQMQDINAYGAAGNASIATAEKGRKTIDFAADRLIEALGEIERAPLSWLDKNPAW